MRGGPARTALALAMMLLSVFPALAAGAPPFTCPGVVNVGSWQRLKIPDFPAVAGVESKNAVTAYSVAATSPEVVVVTNGTRLMLSTLGGCAWSNGVALGLRPTTDVPLSGANSSIVSTTILACGRVLAAVREGTGPASRPHVIASENGRSGYRTHDTGLPAQGAPRLLVAADEGRTLYLVLTPTAPIPSPAELPGIPGPSQTPARAGLLYASTDGGHGWILRTSAQDLPAGGGDLDSLAIDHQNPDVLYAVSNGLLLVSNNGGKTFVRTRLPDADVTAVESMGAAVVAVFTRRGVVALSRDGGHTFSRAPAPAGVTSAAYRAGDGRLAVEVRGEVSLLDPVTGRAERVPDVRASPGTLLGDVGDEATYHALSSHNLLRYVDRTSSNVPEALGADSDFGVPAPTPGVITPAVRAVQLPVGTSAVLNYTLAMKVSRTPVDLLLLLDTAASTEAYRDELKARLGTLVGVIQRTGIDLQVGIASFGTGPRQGSVAVAPPYVNVDDPTDLGSQLYRLHRRVAPVDNLLATLLGKVKSQRENGDRAQLIGLDQAAIGSGVRPPLIPDAVPLYLVPPDRGAAWRPDPGVRRIMVLATDQPFGNPAGSPRTADGQPDIADVARRMDEWEHVRLIGLTLGATQAHADLAIAAAGTRSFAPAGGADCGSGTMLPAGAPLVCDTTTDLSRVTGRLITELPDRQTVTVAPSGGPPSVVTAVDDRALRGLDVTVPNLVPFSLRVSCSRRAPGRWEQQVVATMRGLAVATTRLILDCVGRGAAQSARVAPARAAPPGAAAPVAPVPGPPGPAQVAPIAPAVQAQVQPQHLPQSQVHANPLTVGALQRQEELELELAFARPADDRAGGSGQLAMVDRRHSDEIAALFLLVTSMTVCAALGTAKLRTRPAFAVARGAEPLYDAGKG